MKANELMLGDWVVYRGDAEYTNPVRIEGMDILTNALITEDREDVGFDGIEPIPLTAEILEKNKMREFEHRNPGQGDNLIKKWWHKDGSYYVSLYRVGDEYTYTVGNSITRVCRIKYIHQLQHALRLCGIEKEIEL